MPPTHQTQQCQPKAARSRRRAASWSGATSAIARAGYRRGGSSRRGPEVQVDQATLEFKLVDLALAVVLATRLEGSGRCSGAGVA